MSGLIPSRLARWLLLGEWRAHPLRALLAAAAIAVGVALGFAIHLINAAAFNEFSAAIQSLSGQADVQVAGREALFDEAIYPWLARRAGVAEASPVLELDAVVPGQREALKILGLDVFRAAAVTPGLVGAPDQAGPLDALADDALFLSPAALAWLRVASGGRVALLAGTERLDLRVAGALPRARAGQRLGAMDLAAAQWRFHRLGRLSRVDLTLRDGVDRATFRSALAGQLERDFPGRFVVGQPDDGNQDRRNAGLSRAYRVNLTVLALVALFTGAFLVFSTQALSVVRRRSQLALLRVLGMGRAEILRQVLLEGACLGVAGALLGIAGGYGMAAAALHFYGGDLGAGYFPGVRPPAAFAPLAALVYFGLGVGVALLGCAAPALEAARAAPATALKCGAEESAIARLATPWPALACVALAALLSRAPPLFDLPLPGYLAIALLLVGAIGLMPQLAARVFRLTARACAPFTRRSVPTLLLARLSNAPGQAGIALGGVLSSFSLMVAMAIMVASFRSSVDDWLRQVLPADLYARTAASGNTAGLDRRQQAALAALPGIARVDFLRALPVTLASERPAVMLLARSIDARRPGQAMVLTGPSLPVPAGARPAWVSEAMVDLYGLRPGATLRLPLNGAARDFFVAGIWRDYTRQTGAVQLRLGDYRDLSGDFEVGDAAIWLAPGATLAEVEARLRGLPFGAALELSAPGEIRARSLGIFDRSFAVTYLLEAIAIAIGLCGVAATFSAQTLARAKEFGMLRHIGVTRGQILALLALEGGALTALGAAVGFALGGAISLILVFVVNPQSFHWSMELHLPWRLLAGSAAALLAAAMLTALVAGRYALSGGPIRAVREDW